MAVAKAARRKILTAADEVDTAGPREAAIMGGIVRSLIDTGTMRPDMVKAWMSTILEQFHLANVDRRPPCKAELSMVLQRFEEAFGSRVA